MLFWKESNWRQVRTLKNLPSAQWKPSGLKTGQRGLGSQTALAMSTIRAVKKRNTIGLGNQWINVKLRGICV